MIRGLRRVMTYLERRVMERRVAVVGRLGGVGRRILLLVLGSDDYEELVLYHRSMRRWVQCNHDNMFDYV